MGGNFRVVAFFVEKYLEINLMLYLCEQKKKTNMATTSARRHNAHPVSYYWNQVKDLDNSQKLELISILAESMKPSARSEEKGDEDYSLRPYTMEEVNAMLDEAEAEIAAGKGTSNEEVMSEMDE